MSSDKYLDLIREVKRIVKERDIRVLIPKPIPVTDFPGQQADFVFGLLPKSIPEDTPIRIELLKVTDRQVKNLTFNLKGIPQQRLDFEAATIIPAWEKLTLPPEPESTNTCEWCGTQLTPDNYCESCGAPR